MVKRFIILVIVLILVIPLIFNVCADVLNNEDEIDSEFLDIINNNFYDNPENAIENDNNQEAQPTFSEGMWRCGDCSNINESKLLYDESLEVDTNYNLDESMVLQIGFAVNNMRCIMVQTDQLNTIRRVTGSCIGNEVTLSALSPFSTYIKIYS